MKFDEAVEAVQTGSLTEVTGNLAKDTDADGVTLLHWAALNNRCEIARMLLKNGADVNAKGGTVMETPLMWAMRRKFYAISAYLIEEGADIHVVSASGCDLVHNACKLVTETEGDLHGLFLALHWGVGTEHVDKNGETAMSWVAKNRFGDQAADLMKVLMLYHEERKPTTTPYNTQQEKREDRNSLLHLLASKNPGTTGHKVRLADANIALHVHQHPEIASWKQSAPSATRENAAGQTPYEMAKQAGNTYMSLFLNDAMQYVFCSMLFLFFLVCKCLCLSLAHLLLAACIL